MKAASKLICVFLLGCLITATILAPRAESDDPWWMPLLQWCANYAWQLVENHNQDPSAHQNLPMGKTPWLVDADGLEIGAILNHDVFTSYWVFDPNIGNIGVAYQVDYQGEIMITPGSVWFSGENCTGARYLYGTMPFLYPASQRLIITNDGAYSLLVGWESVALNSTWDDGGCVNLTRSTDTHLRIEEIPPPPLPESFTPPLKIEMR